jgi:hypothetical protein
VQPFDEHTSLGVHVRRLRKGGRFPFAADIAKMGVIAVLAVNAFLAAFAGTWACTVHTPTGKAAASHWTIAAQPSSAWAIVQWSSGTQRGTVFVGYVGSEGGWVYEDFHSDGGFGSYTSPGPQAGVWTWSGEFSGPNRVAHGALQWRRTNTGIQRGYGRLIGTSFRESAADACRRE